ncbi:hypothetical protein UlMin_024567 [Ulmus minor]
MLCACFGEQFKLEEPEPPHSPESLATRDFSASGLSSRTGDWDSKLKDIQVDEAESTLKEALSLNYEEARALLGRPEYQSGNFYAAISIFQGIDIKGLTPRMSKSKGDIVPTGIMSLHSLSLLIKAILLKARSLEELGRYIEAAKECKIILDSIDSALPNGIPEGIALELLPNMWIKAGFLDDAITTYRWALKNLAVVLLYGGVEVSLPPEYKVWGPTTPDNSTEEAILLLLILMRKVALHEIKWDPKIMDHLVYALSIVGQFELLVDHFEQVLPGIYNLVERWYFLALCYSAAGQNEAALNLLEKLQAVLRQSTCPISLLSFLEQSWNENARANRNIDFFSPSFMVFNCQSDFFHFGIWFSLSLFSILPCLIIFDISDATEGN